MIHNPARSADDHVGRLQFFELPPIVSAAKDIGNVYIGKVTGQLADFPSALACQLPCGRKHQNLYIPGIRRNALHSGNAEGHRLSGSGLGPRQNIDAGTDQRDGLRLNIGGFRKAHLCHRFQQFLGKGELGKGLICHGFPRFNQFKCPAYKVSSPSVKGFWCSFLQGLFSLRRPSVPARRAFFFLPPQGGYSALFPQMPASVSFHCSFDPLQQGCTN